MVTNTVWKQVSDWTVPVWKLGCVNPPFSYGDPHVEMGSRIFLFPIWKRSLAISIWGCVKSPFPNGDPFMETGSQKVK